MQKRYPVQPARSTPRLKPAGKLRPAIILAVLLIAPALATWQLADLVSWKIIIAWLALVSTTTAILYRSDKRRAEAGARRTPESTLHLAEILGGWPAAFVSQRLFRHKISKAAYQLVFWIIILIHQYAAIDFIRGWPVSAAVFNAIFGPP